MTDPLLRAGTRVPAAAFRALRQRLLLDGCKWDAQVGDEATLVDWPLVLQAGAWTRLGELARALAAETLAAEHELVARPELHERLAVPRRVRRLLASRPSWARAAEPTHRLMRFDFHPTAAGWRVSEVNSDVPGGFAESSLFSAGMAAASGLAALGDPAAALVEAIAAAARTPLVALLSAPGFLEDHQVVGFLARRLRAAGLDPQPVGRADLRVDAGRMRVATPWRSGEVGALVRFYQAEWLAREPASVWAGFFGAGAPVFNSASAILTESKRLPLCWPALTSAMPTWRELLPETRELHPRDLLGARGWILKAAYGNNGDGVIDPSTSGAGAWRRLAWCARRWVAQRRFAIQALATPDGPRYPCVGVYTLGERVIGAYGRVARTPIVDHRAADVAVLVAA